MKKKSVKLSSDQQQLGQELDTSKANKSAYQEALVTTQTDNKERPDSEIFLAFHYNELKDLGKHFLTIVSGVLAFSVTFSEKMIDFTKATNLQKILLLSSWLFFIVAVVAAGTGIYLNYKAGAQANGAIIREKKSDFKPLVRRTYRLYEIAGGFFILGLILMASMAGLKLL